MRRLFLYLNTMRTLFLKAKHWQIFLPVILIPLVSTFIFGLTIIISIMDNPPKDFDDLYWIFYLMPFIIFISGFVHFGWLWSVITKLSGHEYIRDMRFPLLRIKLFFWIPIVYILLLPPVFGITMLENLILNSAEDIPAFISMLLFMMIMHFACIFFIMHTIFFVSKIIKSGELKREVTFSDFVGDFFLILFFPIGIWFIQPKINAILKNGRLQEESLLIDDLK